MATLEEASAKERAGCDEIESPGPLRLLTCCESTIYGGLLQSWWISTMVNYPPCFNTLSSSKFN